MNDRSHGDIICARLLEGGQITWNVTNVPPSSARVVEGYGEGGELVRRYQFVFASVWFLCARRDLEIVWEMSFFAQSK